MAKSKKPDGTVWSLPAGVLNQAETRLYKAFGNNGASVMRLLAEKEGCAEQAAKELKTYFLPDLPKGQQAMKKRADGKTLPDLDWVKTYQALGISFDPASVTLVDGMSYCCWPIIVLPGLTCNGIADAFRGVGVNVYISGIDIDLDKWLTENNRSIPARPYVIYVKRVVEADCRLNNVSVIDLTRYGFAGVTLLERLLLGYAYFLTTGKHLDLLNETVCLGSRGFDDSAPSVYYRDYSHRGVCIRWHNSHYNNTDIFTRKIITL